MAEAARHARKIAAETVNEIGKGRCRGTRHRAASHGDNQFAESALVDRFLARSGNIPFTSRLLGKRRFWRLVRWRIWWWRLVSGDRRSAVGGQVV